VGGENAVRSYHLRGHTEEYLSEPIISANSKPYSKRIEGVERRDDVGSFAKKQS
jgi:hypothetical protein